jgi:hypothetical protein
MSVPVQAQPMRTRASATSLWLGIAGLMVLVGAFQLAQSGGGLALLGGVGALVGAAVVIRRPALGIMVYLTTFLFTYPAYLRGVGNFTINNILGLLLLPLMLYGMLREGSWWPFRFRPLIILGAVTISMIASGMFYTPANEYGEVLEQAKIARSQRVQGPALIATRDSGAKLLTRFAFLIFFVFFIRTPRDLKIVVLMIVACLLMTYFSVSTAEGLRGWGTGRLRVMGEAGAGVYAGRNPNKLAYFALFGLTLLWYARRSIKNPLVYPFWAVATLITFVMIPLTGSRSGLLNLLFFIAIVLLEGRFNYRKVIGLTLVTFFIAVQFGYDISVVELFLPEDVASRLTRVGVRTDILEDQGLAAAGSAEGRFRTIQSALRVFYLHPAFGVGVGNFNTERAATDPFGTVGPPHNSYLWALSEGGLVVFILYFMFFWWVFRKLRGIEWEYQARFGPVDLGWMTSALRTVIIGFMLFSFFADMWHHELFYIIVGMCLSLIRLHETYAATGQVPQPFVIGRQLQPARLPSVATA